jgi:hypothetical protein
LPGKEEKSQVVQHYDLCTTGDRPWDEPDRKPNGFLGLLERAAEKKILCRSWNSKTGFKILSSVTIVTDTHQLSFVSPSLHNSEINFKNTWDRIVQCVWQLDTDWAFWGSNPDGVHIFITRPDRPWGPPNPL